MIEALENYYESFQACNAMRRRRPYSSLFWRLHSQQVASKTRHQANRLMVEKAQTALFQVR